MQNKIIELLPRASREISTSASASDIREISPREAKGNMETSIDSSVRYFCHVCTSHVSHVSIRKTSTGELECMWCMQTFVEMLGATAEDDAVRADALPSTAASTAAAAGPTTTATNSRVASNRSSETEHMDILMESLLRGRQRQQQRQREPETTSRLMAGGGGDGGSSTITEEASDDHAAQQIPPVSAPIGLRDSARGRGSSSQVRRNEFWRGSDGVGSSVRVRRSRRVSERAIGSVDVGGGVGRDRDRDRRSGTARIRTALATAAFIRDVMQESNDDIALSLEMVLEQLLVGGGLLPAGLLAGAVGGSGSGVQARNTTGVGDDDGGDNTEGVTGDGRAGARGQGGTGARAAAVRGGGIVGRGARVGSADRQRMLLEAIRAGGGRPPSQLPEVFIAPDMHTGGGRGGGGGGEGGVTGVRLGNTLGSGLGALLRGFTLAGGVGGVGGPGGNVGDYAFGDLSQLIQQLMAADTNRHGPPPASKEIVDALPTIQITKGSRLEGTECAVCKDDFAEGETVRELPCTHAFHQHCVLPWLAERNTCPTCRHELPTDENPTLDNIMNMNMNNDVILTNDNDNGNDVTAGEGRGGGEASRERTESENPRQRENAPDGTPAAAGSMSLSPSSLAEQGPRRRGNREEAGAAFTFDDSPGAP